VANSETAAQINAHSPSESSSTKIGLSPRLGGWLGSRPELSGRDGRCRPLQKREGQFRCKVGFLSTRSSTLEEPATPPSPQLLRRYSWLMVLERAGPCVDAARAKQPQFGSIGRSRLSVLELIDRRPPEGKERGGANAAPSLR
jgi:hypothetical protein